MLMPFTQDVIRRMNSIGHDWFSHVQVELDYGAFLVHCAIAEGHFQLFILEPVVSQLANKNQ